MGPELDQPASDDVTVAMEIQQFFDEWQYRMFHSNLAFTNDRISCIIKALDLLEACGIDMSEEEKRELAVLDETDMVARIVQKMSIPVRLSFPHFALQLQLVVSTATRVRHSLENLVECTEEGGDCEAARQEVAHIMGDGEAGVLQSILKHTIIEAGSQVHELDQLQESWLKSTEERMKRLMRSAEEAEHCQQQLLAVEGQMSDFQSEQSSKSKKVLMTLVGGQGKALVHSVFSTWEGYVLKVKSELSIHQKFRDQIMRAETKLIEMKKNSFNNIRSCMVRSGAEGIRDLQSIILSNWQKSVQDGKVEADVQARLKLAQDKLSHCQQSQQDAAKKVMMRMSAGNDTMLLELVIQTWNKALEQLKQDRLFEEAVKRSEEALADHMSKKSAEARQVMERMLGASDSGLLFEYFKGWMDYISEEKRANEMDKLVNGADARFKSLNGRQKGTAHSVAVRTNRIDEENFIYRFFQEWVTEWRVSQVTRHYGSKLDGKKHQLDAVQSLFKSFAGQLEKGIGNTPRSQRKSMSIEHRDTAARPPAMPGAPA